MNSLKNISNTLKIFIKLYIRDLLELIFQCRPKYNILRLVNELNLYNNWNLHNYI